MIGEPIVPEGHVEPRRGAPGRGHRARADHGRPRRQGRGRAARLRGRALPHRAAPDQDDAQHAPRDDRRHGAQLRGEHAAAGAIRRPLVRAQPRHEGRHAASVGAADTRRRGGGDRCGVPLRVPRRRQAGRIAAARVLLRHAADEATRSRTRSRRRRRSRTGTGQHLPRAASASASPICSRSSFRSDGIVGIFQGAAETGPRALGHRSILANPANPKTLETLNRLVKFRELIRPLAPMATLAAAKKWFEPVTGRERRRFQRLQLHGADEPGEARSLRRRFRP